MIVVKLMGGLGNQMFQYAAAKSLATRLGAEVKFDMSWFQEVLKTPQDTHRSYELNDLNIQASALSSFYGFFLYRKDFPSRVFRRVLRTTAGFPTFYHEPKFSFNPNFLDLPNNTLLVGYFQSEKYFKNIRELLLVEFEQKNTPNKQSVKIANLIESSPISVSLHVRRGDYVTNKSAHNFHGLKSLEYYQAAIKLLEKRVGKQFDLFIFSDDPAWCKENLKFNQPAIYVDHNKKGVEDMHLMKLCDHNIIANSSFSWWGAWLNQNPEKIVITPKTWFNDTSVDTSDLTPAEWVRI